MNKFLRYPLVALAAAALLVFTPVLPARAIFDSLTIEKEKQLGEEFFLLIQQAVPLIGDPFIGSYFNRLGQKIVAQLGPQPFKYRFFIIDDPTVNAFAVPGGYIFVHSGLIHMMEREGELAGVLAHEVSHIYARHMAKTLEKAKVANIATLVGALAGIFLGGVGGAVLSQTMAVGSMAAGSSAMLAYGREFEREADSLGFKWMVKAGYNPRDMVTIFKKMNRQRWFQGGKIPVYLSTHPDIDSRMVDLANQLSFNMDKLPKGEDSPDFAFFTTRMEALTGNANQLLRRMTQDGLREPQNPVCPYGKALALAKLERPEEAIKAFQEAQKLAPGNDLIQRDLATYYFQRNRYQDALKLLEGLARRHPQDDVTLFYLGRIYQERHQNDQALALFEKVQKLNPAFTEVYLNLGTVYGEKKQLGPAHYYLGFYSLRTKALPTALFHFQKAAKNLSPADPRYGEVKRQIARLEKMRVRVRN
jgi:predicted Zn-dependent protease